MSFLDQRINVLIKLRYYLYKRKYNRLRNLAISFEINKRISNFENKYPESNEFHFSHLPRMIQKLEKTFNDLGYHY